MSLWQVERLGRRGDGVAVDAAGSRALAPLVLPGEVIAGEAAPVAGGLARIAQPRIVTPSPQRVAAACGHYRACGGCSLMHGSDAFVASWKVGVVETALAAQGVEARVTGIATSPPRSRRRAVLAGRRLKSGPVVGFHARASGQLVPITDCHVLGPAIMAALPDLRDLTGLLAARGQEIGIAVTQTETGLDIAIRAGKVVDAALMADLAALAARADWARLTWAEGGLTRRPPVLGFGRARVVPPPGAFLQATAEGEAALRAVVLDGVAGAKRVADLYCGIGTFALPMAARAEVHGVEGLAMAIAALDAGWRGAPGLRRVTTETRDLARRPLLPDELARFDAVVVDPPRAGAEAQAHALAQSEVRRIVWVSCDPVPFARDMRILTGAGWRMEGLRVVDQFRWSPHVEMVCILNKS